MAEFEIRRKKDGAVAGIDAPFATIALDMLGWRPAPKGDGFQKLIV